MGFASSRPQGANGPITTEGIRTALRNEGLRSAGTRTGGLNAMVNPETRQAQIDIAHTLGHKMIGTAGDPVGGAGANLLANWQVAGRELQHHRRGAARRGAEVLPAP